jgi:hypothetical protein
MRVVPIQTKGAQWSRGADRQIDVRSVSERRPVADIPCLLRASAHGTPANHLVSFRARARKAEEQVLSGVDAPRRQKGRVEHWCCPCMYSIRMRADTDAVRREGGPVVVH